VIHDALVVAAGYVLGTLPFAQIVAGRLGHDPTTEGSGNPGASNVFRTAGRGAGLTVLAGDALKGVVAVAIGWLFGGRDLALITGVAAVLGHVFPITRGFRGGKGVATSAGVMAVLFPLPLAASAVVWLALVKLTGVAAIASLVAGAALVVGLVLTDVPGREVALVAVLGALVLVRHAGNIARLVRGEEHVLRAGSS
jgi:acyl phosphate:glycerol-3-phosphate acyltransferase